MSFAWPLALLSLVVAPALLGAYWWLLRRRRKQAVRYSSVALLRSVLPRRNRWQRHLPVALLLASLVALAFAAGRPHVERSVPFARTSVILAHGRLGVDVRDRRRAQPAGRCTGSRSRVRRGPAEGRTDGPRRLLRLRGAERSADDRTQGARRRDRVPHDRARHRHRRGDAEGDRRHRRGEPERPTGRRRSRGRATARVGGGARRHRLRAGHRRAPDRRREQPWDRAARCRAVRGRAGRSRVHDRLRNGKPRRAFLHASPTRRPRLRKPVRRVRRGRRRLRRRRRVRGSGAAQTYRPSRQSPSRPEAPSTTPRTPISCEKSSPISPRTSQPRSSPPRSPGSSQHSAPSSPPRRSPPRCAGARTHSPYALRAATLRRAGSPIASPRCRQVPPGLIRTCRRQPTANHARPA